MSQLVFRVERDQGNELAERHQNRAVLRGSHRDDSLNFILIGCADCGIVDMTLSEDLDDDGRSGPVSPSRREISSMAVSANAP